MSTLVRWSPLREMMTMRRDMDRLFDDFMSAPTIWRENGDQFMRLAIDVTEKVDKFVVKAEVPGIDAEELDISITDNVLTIKGESHQETEEEGETYHVRERRYGSFMRSFAMPTAVVADEIEALYDNGVLTVEVPKAEEVKPKKISVMAKKLIGKK